MKTYNVSIGEARREVPHNDDPTIVQAALASACAELTALYPDRASDLRVTTNETVHADALAVPAPDALAVPAPTVPPSVARPSGWGDVIGDSHVSLSAAQRIAADSEAATRAGFVLKEPLFRSGTMVMQAGVEAAQAFRDSWERMPTIHEALREHTERIAAEKRADAFAPLADIRMDSAGKIVLPSGERLPISDRAFRQFVQRAGYPGGGAGYLAACPPTLRAANVNNQALLIGDAEKQRIAEAVERNRMKRGRAFSTDRDVLRLRTRNDADGARYVYAVVTDGYVEHDADRLAETLRKVFRNSPDLRVETTYDGASTKFQVMANSDVKPEDYAAGEIFRAGVQVRTDDTGGGAIIFSGFAVQNLCLNLQILHHSQQNYGRFIHRGNYMDLEVKIRAALEKSRDSIAHFLNAWGLAKEEELTPPNPYLGIGSREIIAAWFNGVVKQDLVPVVGRKVDAVPALVRAWERDEGAGGASGAKALTRAGMVNAFTRYAHETDPMRGDVHDAIVEAASDLLYARRLGGKQSLPTIPFALTEA